MTKCNNYRQNYIDIIKGWAIIMVVVFHVASGVFSNFGTNILGGNKWNIAIFFIVGGFFITTDKLVDYKTFFKRKFKSLYVPATIIYLLAILLHNVFIDVGWYPLGETHPGTGITFDYYSAIDYVKQCGAAILCAGHGELVMGAMWYLYTLIYALIGLAIVWGICRRFRNADYIMGIILISLMTISCILTQVLQLTINRVNITMTAMGLIYIGMLINQKLKLKFNNPWIMAASVLIFVGSVAIHNIDINLARNQYPDVITLVAVSCCFLYVVGFFAKTIENSILGNILAYIGRDSLYIMALHILGLFACNSILLKCGVFASTSSHGMYTYLLNGSIWMLLIYTVFGVSVPLLIMYVFRKIIGIESQANSIRTLEQQ